MFDIFFLISVKLRDWTAAGRLCEHARVSNRDLRSYQHCVTHCLSDFITQRLTS